MILFRVLRHLPAAIPSLPTRVGLRGQNPEVNTQPTQVSIAWTVIAELLTAQAAGASKITLAEC